MTPTPALAGEREGCRERGDTVLANGRARIFAAGDGARYGCVYGRRAVHRLAAAGALRLIRLVGLLAAFADVSCTGSTCSYDARTLNLRTGRRVRRFRALGRPRALELGRTGSFAVITQSNSDSQTHMVHAVRNDSAVLLDVDKEIEPRSLAVGGGRVYWTAGGEPRSALLR